MLKTTRLPDKLTLNINNGSKPVSKTNYGNDELVKVDVSDGKVL